MPMPAQNTPWPPKEWAEAYAQYAENDAWLTGDVQKLATIYQSGQATHTRGGQPYKGGLVGAVSRMFWGRPIPVGEQRTRVHVPAPADVATLASDLQYSDPPETVITSEKSSETAQARLDLIMNSYEAHAMFNAQGELKSALGATIITPRWDVDLADHVWLDYAGCDAAVPVFRQGRLVEITLWSEFLDGNVYWRHLEHHAVGAIEHALFKGTATNLGQRLPLGERPETEPLAKIVNADSLYLTGIDRLTAGYLKNAEAQAWRRKGALRDAGRSDFFQLLPLFDSIDEAFSSWMRDLKLGSGRLIVPESYLRDLGAGSGAAFDSYQEMFVGLQVPGKVTDGLDITAQQFEIRFEAHERTVRGIYREILRKAGFSSASWGDPDQSGGGNATATEIESRTEQSERTRAKKNLYDRQVLSRVGSVALELDGLLFGGKGGGRYDLDVIFPDASRVDPKTEAETIGLLDVAGAISDWRKVERANPEWGPGQIEEELKKIRTDRDARSEALPDPARFDRIDDDPDEA